MRSFGCTTIRTAAALAAAAAPPAEALTYSACARASAAAIAPKERPARPRRKPRRANSKPKVDQSQPRIFYRVECVSLETRKDRWEAFRARAKARWFELRAGECGPDLPFGVLY